jgi:hypothetical protein
VARSRRYRLSDRKLTVAENATLRRQLEELKRRMESEAAQLAARNLEKLTRDL